MKYFKNNPEIIVPIVTGATKLLISVFIDSKSSGTQDTKQQNGKFPVSDHVPQSKINEEYTRKSPIKHEVSSYTRRDGTPVKGYPRGRD